MSTPIICITGDSQTAGVSGSIGDPRGVAAHLRFQMRADITNLAVSGTKLENALAYWNALSTSRKAAFDYVFIAGCYNNLIGPSSDISDYMTLAQNLVNQVNTDKKASCKIFMSTLVPIKSYLVSLYDTATVNLNYQRWLDINQALQGIGANAITGTHGCATEHTDYLNDGSGSMQTIYMASGGTDKLHPNSAGEDVIADSWRKLLLPYL